MTLQRPRMPGSFADAVASIALDIGGFDVAGKARQIVGDAP